MEKLSVVFSNSYIVVSVFTVTVRPMAGYNNGSQQRILVGTEKANYMYTK